MVLTIAALAQQRGAATERAMIIFFLPLIAIIVMASKVETKTTYIRGTVLVFRKSDM